MNKKGFTLVNLLTMLAILTIVVIIALPNIMEIFDKIKKNTFESEVKNIYRVAKEQWDRDSIINNGEQVYSRCKTCSGKSLQVDAREELDYYVVITKNGNVSNLFATDGTYQYGYEGGNLEIENIGSPESLSELNNFEDKIIIPDKMIANAEKFCIDDNGSKTFYKFNPGMTWKEYISSNYNNIFDKYRINENSKEILSTKSGATSYCGTDMYDSTEEISLDSIIKESSEGCYTYHNRGNC